MTIETEDCGFRCALHSVIHTSTTTVRLSGYMYVFLATLFSRITIFTMDISHPIARPGVKESEPINYLIQQV
jgi:hypothetical protein